MVITFPVAFTPSPTRPRFPEACWAPGPGWSKQTPRVLDIPVQTCGAVTGKIPGVTGAERGATSCLPEQEGALKLGPEACTGAHRGNPSAKGVLGIRSFTCSTKFSFGLLCAGPPARGAWDRGTGAQDPDLREPLFNTVQADLLRPIPAGLNLG